MSNTQSQTVNITLPKALLKEIDAIAKRDYTSRSDIIRQTMLQWTRARKRRTSVDEWGDEGHWTTLIDFRSLGYPGGMHGNEFLARLEESIDGQDR